MVGAPLKTPSPPAQAPAKPRPNSPQREGGSSRGNGRLGPVVRAIVSVWIVWHFTGIFLAALSIGPSSPLIYGIAQGTPSTASPMQWYLDALYLNQGHSFFAPEVGPGHVIHYEVFDRNNRVIEEGTLPNKKEHRPRLFYHRHMMLADQADVPTDDDPRAINWQRKYLEAYARHLLRGNRDAQQARVQNYAHWPLPSSYVMEGRKRGYEMLMRDFAQQGQNRRIDEQGFELIAEAVQRRSDLPPEPEDQTSTAPKSPFPNQAFRQNQNLNWQGERSNVADRWTGGRR
jgi:hypothetical protein